MDRRLSVVIFLSFAFIQRGLATKIFTIKSGKRKATNALFPVFRPEEAFVA